LPAEPDMGVPDSSSKSLTAGWEEGGLA
jgi:hypothetical protein